MAKDYTQIMDAPYAILTQFQRDFSFENPGIMKFLTGGVAAEPQHNMDWDLSFNKLQETDYDVVMKMTLVAKNKEETLYIVEAQYGAIVRINPKNEDMTQPILSAEVPAHLYPFIRAIIAKAVSDGGYPPLLLPAIDFHGHFMQRMQEMEKDQSAGGKGDATQPRKVDGDKTTTKKKSQKLN